MGPIKAWSLCGLCMVKLEQGSPRKYSAFTKLNLCNLVLNLTFEQSLN